jgi:uncharacterized protein (TIGR02646 family)
MIRIVKPAKPPKILTTKGAEQTRKDCAAYDDNPADHRSGEKIFNIDSNIYRSESVRKALRHAQYDKCCYCESKFLATSYGPVEYYRPKGAVQQALGQKKEYPGYYWLAYDWNNLLFSCTACNTKKGELFPLIDKKARARSHHDDITMEQPLLINPTVENPRDHIHFREDMPEYLTETGKITIQYLDLCRAQLKADRREWLEILKTYRDFIEVTKNSSDTEIQRMREKALQFLAEAISSEAKYSSMAQDFINAYTSFSSDILPNGD